MPERARNLSEVLNSHNSIDSGGKAIASVVLGAVDFIGSYSIIETPIWWLKLAGASVISAPFAVLAVYQIIRSCKQGEVESEISLSQERIRLAVEKLKREQHPY